MTAPLHSDPERHAAASSTSTSTSPGPALDDGDEPWGYECALPFLQVVGEPLESGTDACPRNPWR